MLSPPRASVLRPLLPGAALVLALVAAYAPALRGGFLWDDDAHISANPTVVGPLGLKEIWTSARANYFPLVLTSFRLQHAIWGLNPFGYHVVTLACHALAAVLLWRVLLALRVPAAWFGATLWALHPVQVESVAWICELKNTQSAVFFLAAVLFWLKWLEVGTALRAVRERSREIDGRLGEASLPRGGLLYFLALLCALLAILSKSSTVMLPVVLALCTWWQAGRVSRRNLFSLVPCFHWFRFWRCRPSPRDGRFGSRRIGSTRRAATGRFRSPAAPSWRGARFGFIC
jgi:protein O-mannosyl-transferase